MIAGSKPKRAGGKTVVARVLMLSLLSLVLPGLRAQWVQTTSLPAPYSNHTLTYSSGYLYQAGGSTSDTNFGGSNVFYARVDNDGTIGSWNAATPLPDSVAYHAGVTANGFVYVLGGVHYNPSEDDYGDTTNIVYYAQVNPDGSLGSWQTANPLPDSLQFLSASVWNNQIYVIGGFDEFDDNFTLQNTVYSATIQTDGSLSAWTTQAPIPVATWAQAEAANGFLYVLGGAVIENSAVVTNVYYSKINADGTLAGWNQTASLPQTESAFGAVAANGCVFSVGGVNNDDVATSNVYCAAVNGAGSLCPWSSGASLPQPLYFFGVAASGSNIFVSGGQSTEETSSAVYSMALPAPPAPPVFVTNSYTSGDLQLQLAGATDTGFGLLASTNLMTWNYIGYGFTDTNGSLLLQDTNAAGFPNRFYRAFWPLPYWPQP
jgi:hypothetical protein